jgi:hypothetical protein|tara:strand:+ start:1470 stop:1874 length:405 start_codon:yes stop_codon:yes gene_type:complete
MAVKSDLDAELTAILLNSNRTRAFFRRLKKAEPDKWQHAVGNVNIAYHVLKPKDVRVSSFLVGVYDPTLDDKWPWHCHYEDGQYLSNKKRLCGFGRAAEFSTAEEARQFFHTWENKRHLKMELIERQRIEKVEQ